MDINYDLFPSYMPGQNSFVVYRKEERILSVMNDDTDRMNCVFT